MSNEVTVEVTITERQKFSTRVKMPMAKYKELEQAWINLRGAELRRAEEEIGDLCDRQLDWQDADDLEIEDFRVVPDE